MAVELVGGARVSGYLVQVITEDIRNSVNVPRQPVEEGVSITDHVEHQPKGLSISGILTRPTVERLERLITTLESFMNDGKIVTYEGRRIYTNMLIESFDYDTDASISNGYNFSMSLVQARIVESSYVQETKPVTNSGRKQTENQKSDAKYHTVKKGDTFWGLQQKYGTPWKQIQQWSGYEPSRLPVGVKIRVA